MAARDETGSAFRDYAPLALFALVTIGGMVFIWTAKLWGWPTWFATAVPLVLMAIYFLAGVLLDGFRLQNEQAGDNLYYMGFLFTLSSLGVSLYLFTGETSIDTIVRNFGIAVTSTIAGVTLRILFNQMRRDPMDIERNVRHELVEMTRRVRAELDSSAREFANYRRVSNQMLSEGFDEIVRQAEKNGEDIRKVIEALSKDAIRPVQEAAEKLSAIIENHNNAMDDRTSDATAKLTETTTQLALIIGRFATSVEDVSKRLTDIRPPEDIIRIELTPALDAIREMTEAHLKRMEANTRPRRALDEQTEATSDPLRSAPAMLDRAESNDEVVAVPSNEVGDKPDERQAPLFQLPENETSAALSGSDPSDIAAPLPERLGDGQSDEESERRRWFRWQRT